VGRIARGDVAEVLVRVLLEGSAAVGKTFEVMAGGRLVVSPAVWHTNDRSKLVRCWGVQGDRFMFDNTFSHFHISHFPGARGSLASREPRRTQ